MREPIDLDAYLARIGWRGARAADLDALRGIVASHAAAIPFENLDPFMGVPIALDAASLERKLVHGGRGGYCFEHNLLLGHALAALGFEVSGLAARVLWNRDADAITARGHMLLRVELDGATHLVDVGFGGLTLTGVLRLEPEIVQPTPHEPFRLVRLADGDWRMEASVRGVWQTLYRFDLQRQHRVDYEVTSYFLSANPASHFVTGLIAARAAPGLRFALRGRDFAVHTTGGETARRTLSTSEIMEVLERDFLVRLPDREALERRLASLP
ncbi:MAG TPA: arylamine N-acetyltransferase [Kofleriaceae bacterium]|nr:arylamine N-acetyltransferase [Kofleriaceae bacterium]